MDRYALAKLIEWSDTEGIAGRKRLQKVVFFLQHAGFPSRADFYLHHYGPYSREIAAECDKLVSLAIVNESTDTSGRHKTFTYTITEEGVSAIANTKRIHPHAEEIDRFRDMAVELLHKDIWTLELASTIVHFVSTGRSFDDEVKQAFEFKSVSNPDDTSAIQAVDFAKSATASN